MFKVKDLSADQRPAIVHFKTGGRWGFYVTGGGYQRRTFELTAPPVGQVSIFDPFFGFFYPVAVPTTQVLASRTQIREG